MITNIDGSKFDHAMMEIAYVWANCSHATRLKVGCVLAKENRIISTGYNGNPSFLENECEDENNKTKSTVIHAEHNALLYAAKEGISVKGSTCYITHNPCDHCSSMLAVSGISTVIYHEDYLTGASKIDLSILQKANIETYKLINYNKKRETINETNRNLR